jgi:hypothetical protein
LRVEFGEFMNWKCKIVKIHIKKKQDLKWKMWSNLIFKVESRVKKDNGGTNKWVTCFIILLEIISKVG